MIYLLKSFYQWIIIFMSQLHFCSSGSCHGFPNQFRLGIKLIPAAISASMWCSYCILSSEEKELYCIDPSFEGNGHLMILRPKTGISSFCKIVTTYEIEQIDFQIYKFLTKCFGRKNRQIEDGDKCTTLTSDGKHLLSSFGMISLIPDGSCVMTAIYLDFPECEDCGRYECHYRIQWDL
jgi:hypothetical protein